MNAKYVRNEDGQEFWTVLYDDEKILRESEINEEFLDNISHREMKWLLLELVSLVEVRE